MGRQVYAWAPGLGEVEHRWGRCICGRIMGRGQSLGVCAEMGPRNTTEKERIQTATAQGEVDSRKYPEPLTLPSSPSTSARSPSVDQTLFSGQCRGLHSAGSLRDTSLFTGTYGLLFRRVALTSRTGHTVTTRSGWCGDTEFKGVDSTREGG